MFATYRIPQFSAHIANSVSCNQFKEPSSVKTSTHRRIAALGKLFTFIALAESSRHLHLHLHLLYISCGLSWSVIKRNVFILFCISQ